MAFGDLKNLNSGSLENPVKGNKIKNNGNHKSLGKDPYHNYRKKLRRDIFRK